MVIFCCWIYWWFQQGMGCFSRCWKKLIWLIIRRKWTKKMRKQLHLFITWDKTVKQMERNKCLVHGAVESVNNSIICRQLWAADVYLVLLGKSEAQGRIKFLLWKWSRDSCVRHCLSSPSVTGNHSSAPPCRKWDQWRLFNYSGAARLCKLVKL